MDRLYRKKEYNFSDTLQAKKSKLNIQTGGIEEQRLLIKDQCTILPTSQSFDFRILFNGNESLLDTFMHPSLVQFLGKVTQSATEKGKSNTTLHDHSKKQKLFMIVCLLANAMDPPRYVTSAVHPGRYCQQCSLCMKRGLSKYSHPKSWKNPSQLAIT